jgi:hypothetical protein
MAEAMRRSAREEGEHATDEAATSQSSTLRPYAPPRLRRLGSVAELTLAGGSTSGDGFRTRKVGSG